MPLIGYTPDAARATRRAVVVDGDTYWRSEWLDGGRDPLHSPTVFLVEQSPGVSLRTHFHRNNQFQVVVRGDGRIGPHPLRAGAIHYAGAYSGYGPIVAGADGIAYFTIRAVHETGSLTMTEHRDAMRHGPKRQLYGQPVTPLADETLALLADSACDTAIAAQPDGVAARVHRLRPQDRLDGLIAPSGSAGLFGLVLAGAVSVDGGGLTRWQSLYLAPGEPAPAVTAGPAGAQLACLTIAPLAPDYRAPA